LLIIGEQAYMDNLLPRVNGEIGKAIARDIIDKFDQQLIDQELKRMDKTNPAVAGFIRQFAKRSDSEVSVAYCGVMVYRLLENQAEADRMKKEI
jgi:hypothetical protein